MIERSRARDRRPSQQNRAAREASQPASQPERGSESNITTGRRQLPSSRHRGTDGPQRLRHESSDYRGPAVVIEKSPPSLSLFGKVMTHTADKTNTTDTRSTCNL